MTRQKRYEYWDSKDGIPIKKWSKWFNYKGPETPYQCGRKLKNEYRDV